MEYEWDNIFENLDCDPCYLSKLFEEDFFDMSYLWNEEYVSDSEMVKFVQEREKYCPCVEEISLDDEVLCDAVNRIESEWVEFSYYIYHCF